MKPKQIKDVKVGGYFTINGKVYSRFNDAEFKEHVGTLGATRTVELDVNRSCLPLDRLGAQVILEHK